VRVKPKLTSRHGLIRLPASSPPRDQHWVRTYGFRPPIRGVRCPVVAPSHLRWSHADELLGPSSVASRLRIHALVSSRIRRAHSPARDASDSVTRINTSTALCNSSSPSNRVPSRAASDRSGSRASHVRDTSGNPTGSVTPLRSAVACAKCMPRSMAALHLFLGDNRSQSAASKHCRAPFEMPLDQASVSVAAYAPRWPRIRQLHNRLQLLRACME